MQCTGFTWRSIMCLIFRIDDLSALLICIYLAFNLQGKTIDESYKPNSTDFLSDSDDEDLNKIDTQLHFGGGKFDSLNAKESGAYGPSSGGGNDLGTAYRSRREELEDRIKRKKMEKAEKMKRKEDQG